MNKISGAMNTKQKDVTIDKSNIVKVGAKMNPLHLISKGYKYILDEGYRFNVNRSYFSMYRDMPDEEYLKRLFRYKMGYNLDLDNPKTLNEKIQWLKLYDRKPKYVKLVDKIEVKKYVADLIGKEYIIPTLGFWKSANDVDFDSLPDKFVLKCSHDSHDIIICTDKNKLNKEKTIKKLNRGLQRNYYYPFREWAYKNVEPRILAEQYLADETGTLTDFKFYCFNGKAVCVLTCFERNTGDTKFYFFDRNWQLKRYNKQGKEAPADFTKPKPQNLEKMFELAEILAKDSEASFIRVDLYNVYGKIYFGELTLYPAAGFDRGRLPETDRLFGSMVDLNK